MLNWIPLNLKKTLLADIKVIEFDYKFESRWSDVCECYKYTYTAYITTKTEIINYNEPVFEFIHKGESSDNERTGYHHSTKRAALLDALNKVALKFGKPYTI